MYATMGDQCLIKNLGQNKLTYKTEVAAIITDFDNEQKCSSASELKLRSNVHF